jgi:hypothetical protein
MSQEKWNEIQALDLTNVKANLYRRQKGFWMRRWWRKNMNRIEYEYRKFLYLICIYANNKIVPWGDIKGWCPLDEMWHEHILDTHKYARDCNTIFGRMIHHDPNLPAGTTNHTNHWEKTKRVYKEVFKVDL